MYHIFLCDQLVAQTPCILYFIHCRSEIEDIKDIVGKISLNLKYDAFPYITKDLVKILSSGGIGVMFSSRVKQCSLYRNLGYGGNGQDNPC